MPRNDKRDRIAIRHFLICGLAMILPELGQRWALPLPGPRKGKVPSFQRSQPDARVRRGTLTDASNGSNWTPATKSWLCRLPIPDRHSEDRFVGVRLEGFDRQSGFPDSDGRS